jgi:hypothetical protein
VRFVLFYFILLETFEQKYLKKDQQPNEFLSENKIKKSFDTNKVKEILSEIRTLNSENFQRF